MWPGLSVHQSHTRPVKLSSASTDCYISQEYRDWCAFCSEALLVVDLIV